MPFLVPPLLILPFFVLVSNQILSEPTTSTMNPYTWSPSVDERLEQFLNENPFGNSSKSIGQEFKDRLYQAALDVATLHRNSRSPFQPPYSNQIPRLNLGDPKISHAYTFASGIANREDTYVTAIRGEKLLEDLIGVSSWKYVRYNHTDVLLAVMHRHLVIWKQDLDNLAIFDLRVQSSFAILNLDPGKFVDCLFFVKKDSKYRKLYLAVTTYWESQSVVQIYLILHNKILPVSFLKLNQPVVRLSYMEIENDNCLMTLGAVPEYQDAAVSFQDDLDREIKVGKITVTYPVDMVTFVAHGKTFAAVTNNSICDVFEFQSTANYLIFDRIGLRDIVDLETFKIGSDVYLIIAGAYEQLLFKVNENELSLRQRFAITGLSQMSVFYASFCRDDVALMALKETAQYPVIIFIWRNGVGGFETVESSVVPEYFRPSPRSTVSFSKNHTIHAITVDRQTRQSRIFSISVALQPLPDPTLVKSNVISDVMEDLEARLQKFEKDSQYYRHVFNQAVKVSRRISAHQVLTNLLIELPESLFETGHLSDNGGPIHWQGSKLTRSDLANDLRELNKHLNDLESELVHLELQANDLVLRDSPALITGHKTIHGFVSSPLLRFITLDLPNVGTLNVKQILANLLRLNRPQPRLASVVVKGNLRVLGHLDTNHFNGLNLLHDVLLTSVPQVYNGQVNFASPFKISGNMDIGNGQIGGVDLSKVVTLNGQHVIPNSVYFTQTLRIKSELTSPLVDGVDVTLFSETSLRITHQQELEISPTLHFPTEFSSLRVTGLVNGVDINFLDQTLVRANRPTRMGHLTFHHAVFDGGLYVGGTYDGLRFPDSLFLSSSLDKIVSAPKHFAKVTFKDVVYVDGLVDGLKLPEDAVTLTKDETIPMPLSFLHGIDVENDLLVKGLIDGVDLAELLRQAFLTNAESSRNVNAVFLGTVIVERHFAVTRPSDVDLEAIRNDLIFPDDRLIEITGRKRLTRLTASSLDLRGMLNGYNIKEDFVHLKRDQIVIGRKTFKGAVKFGKNVGTGKNMVDGVNIVELFHNRISLGKNSTIMGSMRCYDTVYVNGNLNIVGTLDGIKFPYDVVLRDSAIQQQFEGKRFLKGVRAKEVLLDGDLTVTNLLDGVPLDDLFNRRVTLSSDQELTGLFYLGSGNKIDRLEVASLNGRDPNSLITDYVTLSTDQTVYGDIFTWSGDTNVFGDITTDKGINGYQFNELKDRVLKLDAFGNFPYAVTFPDGLVVRENLQVDKLNGVNLITVYEEAFKKSTGGVLTGVNSFLSHVNIDGNVDAGIVNGMILRDALFLKTADQTVTGDYTFDTVDISGSFNPLRLINGLDLSVLAMSILRKDRDNVVNGNLHFTQSLSVSGDASVTGLVNGVDLRYLKNEAIFHRDVGFEQFVAGSKLLTGPVIVDGDFLIGYLNGVNLSFALVDMILINRDGEIFGPKTFLKPTLVKNGNVLVNGDLVVAGLVAGVNLADWSEHAAFIDRPLEIQGLTVFEDSTIFHGSLILAGKINGVEWPEDLILLNTEEPQVINGVKVFERLTVETDVDVKGLVNHQYHLPSLVFDTFTVHGDQTITGHKSVEGFVIFDDDVYGQLVNNVNLSKETIHLDRAGEIVFDGRVLFDGELFIRGNLNTAGQVCRVDLPKLAASAVYTDHEQVINGDLHFQDITVHDVKVEGRVAGLDIRELHGDVLRLKLEAEEASNQLSLHNRDIDRAVFYLENVASRSASYLDHVHFHQGFNYSGYPVESAANSLRLVRSENETVVTTYVLDSSGRFVVGSVEKNLMLLITTVQMGHLTYSLWSDIRGHGILGLGRLSLANFSDFIHGDLRVLTDQVLLVTVLRKDTCQLLEMMVNPETGGLTELSSTLIDHLQDPVSVHILKTSSKIYVAIDISAIGSYDVCVRDSNSGVLIYIWDLVRKTALFFQRLNGASKHLAAFERYGVHYLAKSDANYGNRNPKTEIKFYRRDDHFHLEFEYAYSVSIPNVAAFEYFEMEDGYQYLGVVNGTHLTLGHLAESHGGFYGHSVIPCRNAYSVKRVLASDGNAYLVVGQGHSLAKNKGVVNLYRLSWTGSRFGL